jgi:hypothetical protein
MQVVSLVDNHLVSIFGEAYVVEYPVVVHIYIACDWPAAKLNGYCGGCMIVALDIRVRVIILFFCIFIFVAVLLIASEIFLVTLIMTVIALTTIVIIWGLGVLHFIIVFIAFVALITLKFMSRATSCGSRASLTSPFGTPKIRKVEIVYHITQLSRKIEETFPSTIGWLYKQLVSISPQRRFMLTCAWTTAGAILSPI